MAVAKNSGGTVLASFSYDAIGRRISRTVGSNTRHFYYSKAWQMLEERVNTATTAVRNYVWSLAYIDAMVLRDDNSVSGNLGISGSGLGRRLYVQQDGNWNVTALLNTSGAVQERIVYDPYGNNLFLDASGSPTTESFTWIYLHQGGRLELNTGLYLFRNRDHSTALGRWMQQDPEKYVDGINLYQFGGSDPVGFNDPLGLAAQPLPNPGSPNWGPIDPVTGQPKYLPKIPGGWKPVPPSKPYDPKDPLSRPGRWNPADPKANRGPKGGQPSGSWDPKPSKKCPNGHGDLHDGSGGPVQHYDENGNPISDADAHDQTGMMSKIGSAIVDGVGWWFSDIPTSVTIPLPKGGGLWIGIGRPPPDYESPPSPSPMPGSPGIPGVNPTGGPTIIEPEPVGTPIVVD